MTFFCSDLIVGSHCSQNSTQMPLADKAQPDIASACFSALCSRSSLSIPQAHQACSHPKAFALALLSARSSLPALIFFLGPLLTIQTSAQMPVPRRGLHWHPRSKHSLTLPQLLPVCRVLTSALSQQVHHTYSCSSLFIMRLRLLRSELPQNLHLALVFRG